MLSQLGVLVGKSVLSQSGADDKLSCTILVQVEEWCCKYIAE